MLLELPDLSKCNPAEPTHTKARPSSGPSCGYRRLHIITPEQNMPDLHDHHHRPHHQAPLESARLSHSSPALRASGREDGEGLDGEQGEGQGRRGKGKDAGGKGKGGGEDKAGKGKGKAGKDDLGTCTYVKARHILCEKQGKINEAYKKLQEGWLDSGDKVPPAEFAKLAAEYSECPSGKKGGDLGWFPRGKMAGPFQEVAFNTPPGVCSGPFKSTHGYHIILAEGRKN